MWEATGLGSEDLLWASMAFNGGIAGQREAVCGALSGAAVYLGLKHRTPLQQTEKAQAAKDAAREAAAAVFQDFKKQYGKIICRELVGIDFNDAAAVQRHRESGAWINNCSGIVQAVVSRLYAMEGT